ncbi:MAG: acyl-CoA thioesterase [Candidatus Methanomethylicaceae archaeon]
MEKAKKVKDSALESVRWMFPSDANPAGTVFGGAIVRYIDEIAAAVAQRHAESRVVMASMDRVNFYHPVNVGDLLILKASVNYVGNTSMEVGVRVEAENPIIGKRVHVASAYCTMVALDENNKPKRVPRLIVESEEEKRRYEEAKKRREERLKALGRLP